MDISRLSAILLVSLIFVPEPLIAGQKFKGNWSGFNSPTSIEIVKEKPLRVRYCFKKQCSLNRPSGNLDEMHFKFPKRGKFPGAKMSMIKKNEVYLGEYQQLDSSTVYTATLK